MDPGRRKRRLAERQARQPFDADQLLALGARAVMVGRPVLYGLAVGGEAGVRDVLDTLTEELVRAMALCGTSELDALDRDLIAAGPPSC